MWLRDLSAYEDDVDDEFMKEGQPQTSGPPRIRFTPLAFVRSCSEEDSGPRRSSPNLRSGCWAHVRRPLIFAALLKALGDAAGVGTAWLMHELIGWVVDTSLRGQQRVGYHYGILMALCTFVHFSFISVANALTAEALAQLQSALTFAVVDKLRCLRNISADATVASIKRLVTNDLPQFREFITHFHLWWSCPMVVGFSLALLVEWLSPTALVNLAALVVFVIIIVATALQMYRFQSEADRRTQSRVRLLESIFSSFRVIVANNWQRTTRRWVYAAREPEAVSHAQTMMCFMALSVLVLWASYASSTTMFAATYYSNSSAMTAPNVLSALMLLGLLRNPLIYLPTSVNNAMLIVRAVDACQHVVSADELPMYVQPLPREDAESGAAIAFRLDASITTMPPINLRTADGNETRTTKMEDRSIRLEAALPLGQLTLITGPTGSGKSRLLALLAGQFPPTSGNVYACHPTGAAAYLNDRGFVFRGSLEMNVAAPHAVDHARLHAVLSSCRLDAARFGGRSIDAASVSGGELLRISTARVLYSECPIVLLDNPTCGLDPETANRIIFDVIQGSLGGLTRVVASNDPALLHNADYVIELGEDGAMRYAGPPKRAAPLALSSASDRADSLSLVSSLSLADVRNFNEESARRRTDSASPTHVPFVERREPDVVIADAPSEPMDRAVPSWRNMAGFLVGTSRERLVLAASLLLTATWRTTGSLADYALTWSVTGANAFALYPLGADTLFALYLYLMAGLGAMTALRVVPLFQLASLSSHRLFDKLFDAFFAQEVRDFGRVGGRVQWAHFIGPCLSVVDRRLPQALTVATLFVVIILGNAAMVVEALPYLAILMAALTAYLALCAVRHAAVTREIQRKERLAHESWAADFELLINHQLELRAARLVESRLEAHRQSASRWFTCRLMRAWSVARLELVLGAVNAAYMLAGMIAVWAVVQYSPQPDAHTVWADRVSTTATYVVCVCMLSGAIVVVGPLVTACSDVLLCMTDAAPMLRYLCRVDEVRPAEDGDVDTNAPDRPAEPADTPYFSLPRRIHRSAAEEEEGPPSLALDGLAMRYGPALALSDVSAALGPGLHALVGTSGAGKSSLLAALLQIHALSAGTMRVNGVAHTSYSTKEAWRSHFVLLPQQPVFFDAVTLRDNIAIGIDATVVGTAAVDIVERALEDVGLAASKGSLEQPFGDLEFSAGERQLLSFARALVSDRSIMLLDEPTSHVDPERRDHVMRLLKGLFARKVIIVVTHQLEWVTAHADSALVMENGRLVEVMSSDDLHSLIRAPPSALVAQPSSSVAPPSLSSSLYDNGPSSSSQMSPFRMMHRHSLVRSA